MKTLREFAEMILNQVSECILRSSAVTILF